MKKLLGILVLGLLWCGNVNAVSDHSLSIWYQTCTNAGHRHEMCKCHVEVMDEKLSQYEFEKIFVDQQWKIADWMKENVIPICGYE